MNPKQLLNEYFSRRISGKELRARLAQDNSRESRKILAILNIDESCCNVLKEFAPAPYAPQRLVEKVVAVESWIQAEEQVQERGPSRGWLSRLMPAFDVVGHSRADKTKKKSKEPPARKRTRSRKKSIPRPKKNK